MKLLKNKKDKEKQKIDESNKINIIAVDSDAGSFRLLGFFEAERFVEPETNSVFIKNDTLKFMIPLPELESVSHNDNLSNITDRLINLEEKIQDEEENDTPQINEKDLHDEYMSLKKKLRTILYNSSTSFFGSDKGTPLLFVQRKGSKFFPLKLDSDTSTIATITNARNTITRNSAENKRIKYGALNSLGTIGMFFIIVTFLMAAVGTWSWYKAFQVQNEILDQSAYVELVRECTNGIAANNEDIKTSIIDGVAESLKQKTATPKGSGG